MGKIKFIVLLVLATTFLIGCSKEPLQEIADAKAAVDTVIADGAMEYASEDAKKLNDALVAAIDEAKIQQGKFFKNFNKTKKLLLQVRSDADALKAALPAKKEAVKMALLEEETKKATLETAIQVVNFCENKDHAGTNDCWDFERLLGAYTSDVVSYFGLKKDYDTDLKKEAFKKTQEYERKLNELGKIRQKNIGSYFYRMYEATKSDYIGDFSTFHNYDLNRKGIEVELPKTISFIWGYFTNKITFPALPTEKCYSYSPRDEYISIKDGPECHREKIFLQMSEEQGLSIENASSEDEKKLSYEEKKLVIYFIFRVTDAKPYTVETNLGFANVRKKFEPVLIGNPVKVVIANKKTGEIYFDKVFVE